jgi:hypothetical protein
VRALPPSSSPKLLEDPDTDTDTDTCGDWSPLLVDRGDRGEVERGDRPDRDLGDADPDPTDKYGDARRDVVWDADAKPLRGLEALSSAPVRLKLPRDLLFLSFARAGTLASVAERDTNVFVNCLATSSSLFS